MGSNDGADLSTADVYERMDELEPYTAGELASVFETTKQTVRSLLQRLADTGKIRKKQPEPERAIWIREPPTHECGECGYAYEVKFLHPVFSAVQFCPRCGNQL